MINLDNHFDFFILFIFKTSCILCTSFIASKVLKHATASTRFTILNMCFISVILIPLFYMYLPKLELDLIKSNQMIAKNQLIEQHTVNKTLNTNQKPATKSIATVPRITPPLNEVEHTSWEQLSFKTVLILMWLVVASLIYLRVIIGLFNVWRIAKKSENLNKDELELLAIQLVNKLQLRHNPKVRVSNKVGSPMT